MKAGGTKRWGEVGNGERVEEGKAVGLREDRGMKMDRGKEGV